MRLLKPYAASETRKPHEGFVTEYGKEKPSKEQQLTPSASVARTEAMVSPKGWVSGMLMIWRRLAKTGTLGLRLTVMVTLAEATWLGRASSKARTPSCVGDTGPNRK